mgnify:CR=1 FL=1
MQLNRFSNYLSSVAFLLFNNRTNNPELRPIIKLGAFLLHRH